ncbi:DNA adenine methylase [Frigoribacterium sp. CFBP 13712]|uniref:DNA adenine methylase n=1 Tax=Frigoribacterium sp. CFBP 13712 TaxID=2775309 RepID=UPI001783597C|nr:DNA adenine methylase [Frigoribacterium sp. CFBP 13712]MBD8704904.1 DNA adenine methylase [Frigoribacterium sp. CFBP 13712]
MPTTPSPLRYPGGKTALTALTAEILRNNNLQRGTYAEPFAGGGGLALSLLFRGDVRRIVLNDLDLSIWSMWSSVLNDTDRFADVVENAVISMPEWHRHRETQNDPAAATTFDLGFSTFFLNRTNRSGVLKGGVIGGKDQNGPDKMACRFNRSDLANKIRRIGKYRSSIELHRLDGQVFLQEQDGRHEKLFFFIDPPYFHKGAGLYTNFYERHDHAKLAETITGLQSPWVLTYDWTPEIRSLYPGFSQHQFGINYSVMQKRVGQELMVSSPGVHVGSALQARAAA